MGFLGFLKHFIPKRHEKQPEKPFKVFYRCGNTSCRKLFRSSMLTIIKDFKHNPPTLYAICPYCKKVQYESKITKLEYYRR